MSSVVAVFKDELGQECGPSMSIPLSLSSEQLNILLNQMLNTSDDPLPYAFFINNEEIIDTIEKHVEKQKLSTEHVLNIVYQPQSIFRVRPVSRCSSSLAGHDQAILSVSFSPDGKQLATGSGDSTVRFWDLSTETPMFTGKGHQGWVLCIAWSPDSKFLVSGSMDSNLQLWDPVKGLALGAPLRGHSKWITAVVWEPLHLNSKCSRFASCSKDGTIKVWDAIQRTCLFTFSQHTAAVTCLKWGGSGWIYSGSQDRTIKVWDSNNGKLIKSLVGHAHWINTMALNSDSVLRTGAFDEKEKKFSNAEEAHQYALERYKGCIGVKQPERLVSGSDDFTMILWCAMDSKKPIARLTGHQALVNQVCFSPDGRYIASASFDKSIKLWHGSSGQFITSLRGHVGPVYQVSWSFDSRLIVSGSKDSTMKVWDLKTRKLKVDLPGHLDEVYAVDWSPNGEKVASGGKDKILKIWRE